MHPGYVRTFHISFIAKSPVSSLFANRDDAGDLLFTAKEFLFNAFMFMLHHNVGFLFITNPGASLFVLHV